MREKMIRKIYANFKNNISSKENFLSKKSRLA